MKLIKNIPWLKKLIFENSRKKWANEKYNRIKQYLKQEDSIIDIGAGKCALSWILKNKGYNITSLDVTNLSFCEDIEPIIYDGENIPFADKKFDTALLITVLHHTPKPKKIIKEATRVADDIIIIEDVYENSLQKYLTYFADSLFNFEFIGHPHSNKTDKEWQELFRELNLSLIDKREDTILNYFNQVSYHLKTNKKSK